MLSTPRTHHKKHVCKAREYKHASAQAHQARQHVSMRTHQALQHVSTQNFRLVKFYKNVFYNKFCKITRKQLYRDLFWNNVAYWSSFTEKRLQHMCFPLNLAKFLRTSAASEIQRRFGNKFEDNSKQIWNKLKTSKRTEGNL